MRINNNIGKVLNILVTDDDIYIVYRTFRNVPSYFDTPLNSELLAIHLVSDLQHHSIVEKLSNIQAKCVLLPCSENKSLVIPLTDQIW